MVGGCLHRSWQEKKEQNSEFVLLLLNHKLDLLLLI